MSELYKQVLSNQLTLSATVDELFISKNDAAAFNTPSPDRAVLDRILNLLQDLSLTGFTCNYVTVSSNLNPVPQVESSTLHDELCQAASVIAPSLKPCRPAPAIPTITKFRSSWALND